MSKGGIGGHTRPNQGASDDWLTPPHVLKALGRFDLDPCACQGQPWPTADRHYYDYGLERQWDGRVWLNPPYGQKAALWLEKMAGHGNGIALMFARTETAMFHKWVWPFATAVLFLEGRLFFHRPDGTRARHNSGGPSCLIAYGSHDWMALRACGLPGVVAEGPFRRPDADA